MTEYWVSQGNKWCDFCKIYISNNATSIRTHELGTRHKENVAQKLASIRKDSALKEKEHLMALKDMGKIEMEAKKSYEKDLASMQRLSGKLESSAPPETATAKGLLPGPRGGTPRTQLSGLESGKSKGASRPSNVPIPSARVVKGVASSLNVGKRKRVDKAGSNSSEEAAALAARESARKRMQEREKSLLGLYHGS